MTKQIARVSFCEVGQKSDLLAKQSTANSFRANSNQKRLDNIKATNAIADQSIARAAMVSNLSKLVNGNLSGRSKITLEQYVQATGFDSILAAANSRLAVMSGNQYELKRHEDPNDISGKNALALDVLDNLTGKIRPVSSLSGGESFKASLSLALGLSDRISSSAGGITVDALFIDEGFGTLDETSLNEAINMLKTLSTNNKLIGIISHREELKQAIDKKLMITKAKDKSGSTVSIDLGY